MEHIKTIFNKIFDYEWDFGIRELMIIMILGPILISILLSNWAEEKDRQNKSPNYIPSQFEVMNK